MKKISIIVPIYNTQQYLQTCLESILNQTYKEFELILINDGSSDDSSKIAKHYQEKYSHQIVYYEKENEGVATTRNFGMQKATGDYILFVDSDDFIDKKLLEQLLPYLEEDIDMVKFKAVEVDQQGKVQQTIEGPNFKICSGQEAFNLLFSQDELIDTPCLYAIRREFIKNYSFSFQKGKNLEDFGLIPLMIISANKMVSIPFYGYYYRQSEESITRNQNIEKITQNAFDALFHYDVMKNEIQNRTIQSRTKQNILLFYTNAIFLLTRTLPKEKQKIYLQEIKKRKMSQNIKIRNIKQLIKRIMVSISIPLYLKLQK